MTSLNNFLKTFFIENVSVSAETQYDLQYISVNVSDENKHQILDSLGGRRRKSFCNGTYSESHTVHKEKKRKYYSENIDFIRKSIPSITVRMLHSSKKSNIHIMQKIMVL